MSNSDCEPIFLVQTLSYAARHGAENRKPSARQEPAQFPYPAGRTHPANQQNTNPALVGDGSRNRYREQRTLPDSWNNKN